VKLGTTVGELQDMRGHLKLHGVLHTTTVTTTTAAITAWTRHSVSRFVTNKLKCPRAMRSGDCVYL
jgi:hypothetical protein